MESSGVTPRAWVDTSDLAGVVARPGPFLSLVLAVETSVDNAARRNEVRWDALCDDLEDQGVPDAALTAVGLIVGRAHLHGRTLVAVADASGLLHVSHWPAPPFREMARWAPLPSLTPVVERRQEAPPYVAVVADRNGADLVAVRHGAAEVELTAGERAEARPKVHAGGWSERRYQERAEGSWTTNARDVAERAAALAREVDARLVLLAGDVRALQLVGDALPDDVAALVARVEGSRSDDGGPGVEEADVERLVAEVAARDTAALVEKLAEELGQHDRGRAGVAGTAAALSAGQVEVLLVHDDPADERTAWTGDDPLVVGTRRQEVEGLTADPRECRLVDALVRSALAGGAGVRVLPAADLVDQGVGAVLRWA